MKKQTLALALMTAITSGAAFASTDGAGGIIDCGTGIDCTEFDKNASDTVGSATGGAIGALAPKEIRDDLRDYMDDSIPVEKRRELAAEYVKGVADGTISQEDQEAARGLYVKFKDGKAQDLESSLVADGIAHLKKTGQITGNETVNIDGEKVTLDQLGDAANRNRIDGEKGIDRNLDTIQGEVDRRNDQIDRNERNNEANRRGIEDAERAGVERDRNQDREIDRNRGDIDQVKRDGEQAGRDLDNARADQERDNDAAKREIDENRGNIDQNRDDIRAVYDAADSWGKSAESEWKKASGSIDSKFNSQQDQISSNSAKIGENSARIDNLENAFKQQGEEMRERYDGVKASMHAITNARPVAYGVGEFAVGAGIGASGSKKALAVGGAYRFNEQWSGSFTVNHETAGRHTKADTSAGVGAQFSFK